MFLRFLKNPLNKIYKETIFIFLVLILPIYLISLYINALGTDYIKNSISSSINSESEFYAMHLEDELNNIQKQLLQFINNTDVEKVAYWSSTMKDYEKIGYEQRVLEHIMGIKNSSEYVDICCVYFKSIDRSISTGRSLLKTTDSEYKPIGNYIDTKSFSSIFYYGNNIYLISVYPSRNIYSTAIPSVVVYAQISSKKISDTLEQIAKYKNSCAVLLDYGSGLIIPWHKNVLNNITIDSLMENINQSRNGSQIVKLDHKKYWTTYYRLNMSNLALVASIPEDELVGPLKRYEILFLLMSIVSITIIFIYSFLVRFVIHKPVEKLVGAFKELETGNLQIKIIKNRNDEFGYLYGSFNSMVKKLDALIKQVYEQKIAYQQSELKQLQSQINPHFLYNSFFHLNRLCTGGDYDGVAFMTEKLGKYFRFITRNSAEEIPLSVEVAHAREYIDIQSIRFESKIIVEFDELPHEYSALKVPRLILQPVIENAYEHAFAKIANGGYLHINFKRKNELLVITIEDNGKGIDDVSIEDIQNKLSSDGNGFEVTGIINVSRRLRLKYGESCGLFVSRSVYGGLKVEVRLYSGLEGE